MPASVHELSFHACLRQGWKKVLNKSRGTFLCNLSAHSHVCACPSLCNTRLRHDLAKLEQENFNQKPRRLLTESQFKVRAASRKLSNRIVRRRGSKIHSTWGRSVWEQRASGRSKEELDRREWRCNVLGRRVLESINPGNPDQR